MPKKTQNKIYTQQAVRLYIQYGGPGPSNPVKFAGTETGQAILTGVEIPDQGDIAAIFGYNPYARFGYERQAKSASPADYPKATLSLRNKVGGALLKQLKKQRCPINTIAVIGMCQDISNINKGVDLWAIGSFGSPTTRSLGDLMSFDADAAHQVDIPLTYEDFYFLAAMFFDEGHTIASEDGSGYIAGAFANKVNCGECGGVGDDGTKWQYAITSGDTSSVTGPTNPKFTYSTDYGITKTDATLTGTPDIDQAFDLEIINGYAVVLGRSFASAGFWYSQLTDLGVPGSFSVQQTGFTSAVAYQMYVMSPSEIFIVGAGGGIFKSTDFLAGITDTVVAAGVLTSQNLLDIDGVEDTVVAVGNSGAMLASDDRGRNFRVVTAPVATNIFSIGVKSKYEWWIGTTSGAVYSTEDGGLSWTQRTITGLGGNVQKLVWATDEVGHVVGSNSMATSLDGGRSWNNGADRLKNVPTTGQLQFVAVPSVLKGVPRDVAANFVMVGGLDDDTTTAALYTARVGEF